MISFIVLAHDQELWIGQCLASITEAMESVPDSYEIIVVNDASTDATERIASAFEASVTQVDYRLVSSERIVTSARKLEVAGPLEVPRLLLTTAICGHRYENPWVIGLFYGKLAHQCRNSGNVGKDHAIVGPQRVFARRNIGAHLHQGHGCQTIFALQVELILRFMEMS